MTPGAAVDDLASLDALPAAVVVSDVHGRVVRWNAAAERLYGWTARDAVGRDVVELLVTPGDQEAARETLASAQSGHEWSGEVRIGRADGSSCIVHATCGPLHGHIQLVALVALAQTAAPGLVVPAQANRERELALAAAELGTWRWERATGRTTCDATLERVYGLPPGGFGGTFDAWVSLIHPEDRAQVLAVVEQAVQNRSSYELLHRVICPDGSMRWVEGLGEVTVDAGDVTGSIGCVRDVTSRVVAERRVAALQRVTELLAETVDSDDVARVVVEHARSELGAVSGGIAQRDARGSALVLSAAFGTTRRLAAELGPLGLDLELPLTEAARTGAPVLLTSAQECRTRYPRLGPMLAGSDIEAVACLPLATSSGDTVGVLALGFGTERSFEDDERLLVALAHQCAVALERARLGGQLRTIAERLQRSMAPSELPAVPGVQLGAVYRPGGEAAEQIGGDWYDVLQQDDGTVLLVVGDVMGRGIDAAASMNRVRTAVRAYASVDPDPVRVLDRLDRFASAHVPEEFVTLVVGRLDPASGSLTVASAGHLPVVAVLPDRGAVLLEPPTSPPLGLAAHTREPVVVELPAGAALVLVTDGLVERPGVDLHEELAGTGVRAEVLLRRGATAQDVAVSLADSAPPAPHADDITVLVVRRDG